MNACNNQKLRLTKINTVKCDFSASDCKLFRILGI